MTQNQCGKPTSINRDRLGIERTPIRPLRYPTCRTIQPGEHMTIQDLKNAIAFLEKSFVGQGDQERLFKTIEALKIEIARRQKK
jgi:hypothetical protein